MAAGRESGETPEVRKELEDAVNHPYFEELFVESEQMNSRSGTWVGRSGDRIIKFYGKKDGRHFVVDFANRWKNFRESNRDWRILLEPDTVSEEEARRNSEYALKNQEEMGINAPYPIHLDEDFRNHPQDDFEELEYLKGDPLADLVEDTPPEDLYDISFEVGQVIRDVHDNGHALRDPHFENIWVEENGIENPDGYTVYNIDLEHFERDAEYEDMLVDHLMFSRDALLQEKEKSYALLDGYTDGYGESLGKELAFSTWLWSGKKAAYDREIGETGRIARNFLNYSFR